MSSLPSPLTPGLRPLTLPRPPPLVTPRRRPAPHPVPPAARASRLACSSPAASLAPAASVSGAAAGSGVAHGPAARSGLALGPGAATLPGTLPEARNLGPDPLGRDGLLPGVAERLACTPKARASWDTHARREHTHRRSRKCGGFRKWTARPSLPLAATSPAPEAATSIVISGLGFSEVIFRSRSHASKPIFGVFKLTHLLLTSAGGWGAQLTGVGAHPPPHPASRRCWSSAAWASLRSRDAWLSSYVKNKPGSSVSDQAPPPPGGPGS